MKFKTRISSALAIAIMSWIPQPAQNVSALYCYPGDPPAVYQACVAYSQGIGQQDNNERSLQSIQGRINDAATQIFPISQLINSLNNTLPARNALLSQTPP